MEPINELVDLIISYLDIISLIEFTKVNSYFNEARLYRLQYESTLSRNFLKNYKHGNVCCILEDWDSSLKHHWEMYYAAKGNHLDIIKNLIQIGSIKKEDNAWDWGLSASAYKGRVRLINFFIKHGASDWNQGMASAARGGHLDLINFFIEKGASNWNLGMICAAGGGHPSIINFFIEKGASDWNQGMFYAAQGGHIDIIKFFIEKGASNWDLGMQYAAQGKHKIHMMNIITFLKQKIRESELV